MAKDPAFLFYPGDYLRDTQCLSEKVQVAYDRIMCEHMRNICISQEQLNFFTKRLSEDEKAELMFVLSRDDNGFFIEWVRESIIKRKEYSKSRANNRKGKGDKKSKTYVPHMENEDEIKIDLSLVPDDQRWKYSFELYRTQLATGFKDAETDRELKDKFKYMHGSDIDVIKTFRKTFEFWSTEEGWEIMKNKGIRKLNCKDIILNKSKHSLTK